MADAYTYRAVYDNIVQRVSIVDVTTNALVSGSPVAGFEPQNAFDLNRQTTWKAPTTHGTDFWIKLQTATAVNPNVVGSTGYTFGMGIANHNLGTAGVTGIKYEVSTDGATWRNFLTLGSMAYGGLTEPDVIWSGNATSAGTFAYHRWTFTWPSQLADVYVGQIYCGIFLEWPIQPEIPMTRSLAYPSTIVDTEGGERFVQGRNSQSEIMDTSISGLTRTQMVAVRRMFERQRGGTYPLMVYTHDMPNISSLHDWDTSVTSTSYYAQALTGYGGAAWCHFDQQSMDDTENFTGYHTLPIRLHRTMTLGDKV